MVRGTLDSSMKRGSSWWGKEIKVARLWEKEGCFKDDKKGQGPGGELPSGVEVAKDPKESFQGKLSELAGRGRRKNFAPEI